MVREEDLYRIWQLFCDKGDWTLDLRLRGIYAGTLNRASGPDFQSAEFELDGRIYKGDVEIHVKTSDWYSHRHHLDSNYDNVILHLVLDENSISSVVSSMRREICTLCFKNFPANIVSENNYKHCILFDGVIWPVEDILKEMAQHRLNTRVLDIRKSVEIMTYDQVLFYHMLGLIGKPANESNFKHLASILPWEFLMSIKERHKMTKKEWLALFAIQSGLISTVPEFYPLKFLSQRIEAICRVPRLDRKVWRLSGQRPYNKPDRHIKILANWLYKFQGRSLYHEFKSLLVERYSYANMVSRLEFFIKSAGKEDIPGTDGSCSTLLNMNWGRSKIIEFVGNVILPFYFWEAEHQDNIGFQEYILSLYFYLPSSMRYASLNDLYESPGLSKLKQKKFYINQGLLMLKKDYCDRNQCKLCPLVRSHKEIDKI